MKISIGSDHGGFNLKQELITFLKTNYQIIDVGCYEQNSCDYPVFAKKVAQNIQSKLSDMGILICTTGIGMCITANKFNGIRAALVTNLESAMLTRQHNNSNVICLGAKYVTIEEAKQYVSVFLTEQFSGGRHLKRVELIEENKDE